MGCSTNSTPSDSSQLIFRTASSLLVHPSLASTRNGFLVSLRTAAMVSSSVFNPTLIFRIGNGSASLTFRRVISGVSMPMENVVRGVSAGSSPKWRYSGIPSSYRSSPQRNVDRRFGGKLTLDLAKDFGNAFAKLPRVGGSDERTDRLHRLTCSLGIFVVANNGRTFSHAGDPVPGVAHRQGVTVITRRHCGRPGMAQLQAGDGSLQVRSVTCTGAGP